MMEMSMRKFPARRFTPLVSPYHASRYIVRSLIAPRTHVRTHSCPFKLLGLPFSAYEKDMTSSNRRKGRTDLRPALWNPKGST